MSSEMNKLPTPPHPPPEYTENQPPRYPTADGVAPQFRDGYGYGGDNTPQYGPVTNIQVYQPGVQVIHRDVEAGKAYSGLFMASILVTFFCCWPIGIFAIQRARQAKRAAEFGQPGEAKMHADASRHLMIAAVIVGIICIGSWIAYYVMRLQASKEDCINDYSYNIC